MIINGDSLDVIKTLDDDSIDFVCTDPPYGYSFMGKDWDKAVPSVEIWRECLRVLKAGSFMAVMSAPRSDVQNAMISRLMEAGFRLDFTPIYWTYASGFPKAGNIAKLVDKRLGVAGEVIGQGKAGAGMNKVKGFGQNTTKGGEATTEWDVRSVASDEAKALDGSYAGFQPKPAVEVIIVAMKPLSEKTYVDQALKNGKGVSWLDDCRVPFQTDDRKRHNEPSASKNYVNPKDFLQMSSARINGTDTGRFPANLLVSDDVLNDGVERKSGGGIKRKAGLQNNYGVYGKFNATEMRGAGGDSGSYSRYFDLDKWANTLPFLITPKASKSEKNKGLEHLEPVIRSDRKAVENIGANNPRNRTGTAKVNHHPTVKPLKLMSYLITLFSRENDTILDPFVGSGTTVIAAHKLNRKGIGIENEKEYADLAEARVAAAELEIEQTKLL